MRLLLALGPSRRAASARGMPCSARSACSPLLFTSLTLPVSPARRNAFTPAPAGWPQGQLLVGHRTGHVSSPRARGWGARAGALAHVQVRAADARGAAARLRAVPPVRRPGPHGGPVAPGRLIRCGGSCRRVSLSALRSRPPVLARRPPPRPVPDMPRSPIRPPPRASGATLEGCALRVLVSGSAPRARGTWDAAAFPGGLRAPEMALHRFVLPPRPFAVRSLLSPRRRRRA